MEKKILGYILTAAGFALLIISLGLWNVEIPFLNTFKPLYITFAGLILAIIGAFLAFGKSHKRAEQEKEEVPIYEGLGKKKKIVAYRRKSK